jgi:hypothetical protein
VAYQWIMVDKTIINGDDTVMVYKPT